MADSAESPAPAEAASRPPGKRRSRPWHRVLGALTALPLVWVMITGAALNHTVGWKLDQIHITHPWILRAYGMTPAGDPSGLLAGSHEVTEWDGQIFLDAAPLETTGSLLGAAADPDGVAVVTTHEVLLLDPSGALIESLGSVSLPELPLTGVAVHEGKTLLENAAGWSQVGEDWLDFTPAAEAPFARQSLSPLANEDSKNRLRAAWSRGGLPASRVVLDLHAGRFLGPLTTWFYDIVVVCTLWLCLTGMILLLRKPRRPR